MGRRKGRATTDIVGQAPINFPTGSVLDFAGSTAPDGWLLCFGQAVSRTDYAALFAALGTTYGVGDGSTTFNLPDCRGVVKAGKDNMGGVASGKLTSALSGVDGVTLGASGGAQSHTIGSNELPTHTHGPGTLNITSSGSHDHVEGMGTVNTADTRYGLTTLSATTTFNAYGETAFSGSYTSYINTSSDPHTHTSANFAGATANNSTLGQSHKITQPTIIFNTIIKV